MVWYKVKDNLPDHKEEASKDVIWAVIEDEELVRWDRGNVGTNGRWAKDCRYISWIPTHWAYVRL